MALEGLLRELRAHASGLPASVQDADKGTHVFNFSEP